MIGIIGAMEIETAAIIAELKNAEYREWSGIRFAKGEWQGKEVVVATSGVGKVFAALCAEAMILSYRPEKIVNTGVAGALAPKLHLLNVVAAADVVQHDMDTSPIGDPKGLLSGINKIELPADEGMIKSFEQAAAKLGIPMLRGRIASGDQFIATEQQRDFIRSQFHADCCEMEGAAIGQVCYVNQIPFAVLRTISDGAAEDAKMDYPAFAAEAARQSVKILKEAMKAL